MMSPLILNPVSYYIGNYKLKFFLNKQKWVSTLPLIPIIVYLRRNMVNDKYIGVGHSRCFEGKNFQRTDLWRWNG